MQRRDFLKRVGQAAGGLSLLAGRTWGLEATPGADAPGAAARGRVNVLYILVDQWRYAALGHGHAHDEVVRTENLDRFAREGAAWRWCYAAQPLCTPNRAATLTGRLPHELAIESNSILLAREARCMAEPFNEAGYQCHYIGKWHLNGDSEIRNYRQSQFYLPGNYVPKGWRRRGFTTFEGFNRGHRYLNSCMFTDDGQLMRESGRYRTGEYEPTLQTDLAIEFMQAKRGRPWFCFVSYGPPHTPYGELPAKYRAMYDPEKLKLRPNVRGVTAQHRQALAWYFGQCTALDAEFGRLMAALEELGLREKTLVVFTADHGDMHRSHGLDHKTQPEEESCHVPLLMRLPGVIEAGREIDHSVSTIDLMPTVVSLCGLESPACTGTDKSPLLRGEPMAEQSVYAQMSERWRMVVKDGHKLIVRTGFDELYNLEEDPYEMRNVIDEPAYAAVRAELIAEYRSWRQNTGDYYPVGAASCPETDESEP